MQLLDLELFLIDKAIIEKYQKPTTIRVCKIHSFARMHASLTRS